MGIKNNKVNQGMPTWLSIIIIAGGFILMLVFDSQMSISLGSSAGTSFLITIIIFALVDRRYQNEDMSQGERLDSVKKYLQEHKEITNKEHRELTGASEATATRDLDELEKLGVVVQVGKTGRYTKYRLKG